MTIAYHVYTNFGTGGAIDYSTPFGTVSGLSWTGPPLGVPSDTTFGVRAFRVEDLLEESNTDATARVRVGPGGVVIPAGPGRCLAVTVRPGPGRLDVSWFHSPGGGLVPDSFAVWATAGAGVVDYAASPAVLGVSAVSYRSRGGHFGLSVPGLAPGPYRVAVRARSGSVDDGSVMALAATVPASAPGAPEGLVITQSAPGLRTGSAMAGTAP